MRALITGISGFVGSHLAEHLLAHSHWEVFGALYGKADNIAHLQDRIRLHAADLSQPEVVKRLVEDVRPDYIFHLAAQSIPWLSQRDPWGTLEINIRAQLNVLEAVVQAGLDCRVLVVGSSEEYGRVTADDLPVDEETPLRPTTPYAVSKVAQDFLGLQYHLARGVPVVRVRPFNHIGPRQSEGFVAPDFARQIAEIEAGKRPPQVRVGALDVARDFSDVRDIVRGYHLVLVHGEPGEVYNLGSGRPHTVRALLETLVRLAGVQVEVVQDPARTRGTDIPCVAADCTKIRDRTGWQAELPFEKTLADVLDDWRGRVQVGG